jgi:hypothetical protein
LWVAIALVIIIAGYFSYKKYRQKKSEQPVEKKIIIIPPHVKALAALDNLESEQLWQKGFIKDYHSRITEIIRNYFEERFDLPAMELTTTETIQHLKGIKEKVIIPPHVKALAALDNLESEQLWQKGFIKDYHSRITEIIRNYFEESFDLPAMELTTTETIQHLKGIKEKVIILDITYNFLSNADLVKFAKFQPFETVNEEMMKQAKEIVQSTIPQKPVITEEVIVNA